MKFPSRQQPVDGRPGVSGTARVDRRTGALVRRLRRGDIAVIDHLDLDRAHAQALVDAGVVAVVNASPFISGRYPNLGPDLLAKAGVLMLDNVGAEVFTAVSDGSDVRIDACERPRHLAVTTNDAYGAWKLEVTLAQQGDTTELTFVHRQIDLKMVGEVGPGWEYYLDNLVAARAGEPLPTFEEYYPSQKEYFLAQV